MILIKEVSVLDQDAVRMREELAQVLELITGCSGNESFQESLMDNEKSVFVVAYQDNQAVGCGAIHPVTGTIAELKRLYAKCHGVGGVILQYLEDRAKEYGYQKMILETRKVNMNAVRFYEKHSYLVTENYGKYIGVANAVCFEKLISADTGKNIE